MPPSSDTPTVTVVSPGKLVLLGEYAVLDGAPSIVLAIDRGVSCQGWPGGDALHIETPTGDDRFVRWRHHRRANVLRDGRQWDCAND